MPVKDQNLVVVGVNHRSSSQELRDRFAVLEADTDGALEALLHAGAREGVLIATCDRVELVSHDAQAVAAFAPLVAARASHPEASVTSALYRHDGEAALRHLFGVASALDSLVIGEPHVLGQLRAAHRAAAEHGLVSPALEDVFVAAFGCARRIRRDTRIAERPVSHAAAAHD